MRTQSPTPLRYSRELDQGQYPANIFNFHLNKTGSRSVGTEKGKSARRVLVVDDNSDSREMIAVLVELSGHQPQTAGDGAEAIHEANLHRPDAILLDIGLPDMTGYDVCRRLREQDWASEVPIIALSGWSEADAVNESKEAGFDAHLVKPVDPADLIDLLSTLE